MDNIKSITNDFKYTWWDRVCGLEPFQTIGIWYDKVIKIFKWVPVLWRDEDWEPIYILEMLEYKLSLMQKCQEEDPYHLDDKTGKLLGPILAKDIQEARDCINRIVEGEYCKKEWEVHDKKHGKLQMVDDGPPDKSGSQKVKFIPDTKAARQLRNRLHKLEEKREKEDYDKLFDILKNESKKWWT